MTTESIGNLSRELRYIEINDWDGFYEWKWIARDSRGNEIGVFNKKKQAEQALNHNGEK